jgi:hypothetical protein
MDAGTTSEEARCQKCGHAFGGNERFCRRCGTPRASAPEQPSRRAGPPTEAAKPVPPPPSFQPPGRSAAAPPLGGDQTAANPTPSGYPTPPGGYQTPPPGYPTTPETSYPGPPPIYPNTPHTGYQVPPPGHPVAPQVGYPSPPLGYPTVPQGGYPTPPAGYPAPPSYPSPPNQPEQNRSKSTGWLVGGVAAATLAIVGIGVGIYAATSGDSSGPTQLVATPAPTGGTTGASPASSTAASSSSTRSAAPSSHAQPRVALPASVVAPPRARIGQVSEQQAVANTIQRHFSLITQHKFSAAYALLAPSLQTGESSWIASHEGDGIYNVNVAVNATVHSESSATASIAKMTTLDGHGCKNWSGSWGLTKIAGQWRISESNISSTPC